MTGEFLWRRRPLPYYRTTTYLLIMCWYAQSYVKFCQPKNNTHGFLNRSSQLSGILNCCLGSFKSTRRTPFFFSALGWKIWMAWIDASFLCLTLSVCLVTKAVLNLMWTCVNYVLSIYVHCYDAYRMRSIIWHVVLCILGDCRSVQSHDFNKMQSRTTQHHTHPSRRPWL